MNQKKQASNMYLGVLLIVYITLTGNRNLRLEKCNEQIKDLQERIEKLSQIIDQLEKDKEMLERKIAAPSTNNQNTSVSVRNSHIIDVIKFNRSCQKNKVR